jgi:hypothetical protein
VVFLGFLVSVVASQIYRYRRVSGPVQRQQTKWVVYGVTVGFGGFILAGLVAPNIEWLIQNVIGVLAVITAQALFILLIPLSIGVAILRQRLYEIDLLINRTLVYVPLTAILAGLFAATSRLLQSFFRNLTGQDSEIAGALTTLIVVAAFEPIRNGIRSLVDKRFKEAPDPTKELNVMREQTRSVLQVMDREQLARGMLDKAVLAFNARGGALLLGEQGNLKVSQAIGEWNGEPGLALAVQHEGVVFGQISLGERRNGTAYTEQDRRRLQEIADLLAHAIALERRTG